MIQMIIIETNDCKLSLMWILSLLFLELILCNVLAF